MSTLKRFSGGTPPSHLRCPSAEGVSKSKTLRFGSCCDSGEDPRSPFTISITPQLSVRAADDVKLISAVSIGLAPFCTDFSRSTKACYSIGVYLFRYQVKGSYLIKPSECTSFLKSGRSFHFSFLDLIIPQELCKVNSFFQLSLRRFI